MKNFTKGEWKVSGMKNMMVVNKDHSIIAECKGSNFLPDEEKQANAQLICDAVNGTAGIGINPNSVKEMKEALEEVSPLLDGLINRTPTGKKREELCDMNIKVKTALKNSAL